MKTVFAFSASLIVAAPLLLGACSSDDDKNNNGQPSPSDDSSCLASAMTFKETKVTDSPSQNVVLVDFDVTNTSSTDYDVSGGSKLIEIDVEVTTSDGSSYESSGPLTAIKVSAGKTASATLKGDYGAGKTYKSYTTKLRCR